MDKREVTTKERIALISVATLFPVIVFFFNIKFISQQPPQQGDYIFFGIGALIMILGGSLLLPVFRKRW
ncbi:MAG: hypothetical protein WC514_02525 [Candidatus Paceibacterota bacterium]